MNREAICRNSSAAVVIALKKIHYPFQSIKSFDRFKNLLQGLTSIRENVIANNNTQPFSQEDVYFCVYVSHPNCTSLSLLLQWSQFPPANPLIPHFFGILFFFLWIVSFLGNGCVIYIFLKVKGLRTPVSLE